MEIKYLPLDERIKVACYHSSAAIHSLWRLDSDSGRMVCFLCGKPAPPLVLRICPTCFNQFVLDFDHPRWDTPMHVMRNGDLIERHIECDACY